LANVLLTSFGSYGDINPFIGLGTALKARGHSVTFATNPYYEGAVSGAGINFLPIGTREEFLRHINHPDLWDPEKVMNVLFRELRVLIRPTFELVRQFAQQPDSIIVASWMLFGARMAQEKFDFPLVTVDLQPAIIPSLDATPVQSSLDFSKWPRWAKWAVNWYGNIMVRKMLEPDFSQLREELGLASIGGAFDSWYHSPLLTTALWPEWFGPPQRDWPANIRLAGFPLYDEVGDKTMPVELETFLNEGPPPVVFTPGSSMAHGKPFFEESVKACVETGYRGILVTRFVDQLPENLPPHVHGFSYIPFSLLLPRCAALVHAGGIGNISQAFAAGIPQIVMPLLNDQPDNAVRVQRLGAGLTIQPADYRSRNVAELLNKLHKDPSYRSRAHEFQQKMQNHNGLLRACELIEQAINR